MPPSSLDSFFNPNFIAVVGASPRPSSLGHVIVKKMMKQSSDNVYAINSKGLPVLGVPGYQKLCDLPHIPDLIVVAVPSKAVLSIVEEAADLKIPAMVIISAGFREIGNFQLEQDLYKRKGISRIIGPNCLGVIDRHTGVDTDFAKTPLPDPGNVSLIMQSGAVGGDCLMQFYLKGIRLAKFVSYGNGVDVNETELLGYLSDDPQTEVIGMYLEGILGSSFREAAEAAVCKKPVVAFIAGGGIADRATLSHTGSLASNMNIIKGAFRQIGVLHVTTLTELIDAIHALSMQPIPPQPTTAIVSNVGGPAMAALMQCQRKSIELSHVQQNTSESINEYLAERHIHAKVLTDGAQAPLAYVDATGSATGEDLVYIMDQLLADTSVGGGIVISRSDAPPISQDTPAFVGELHQRHPQKPILVYDIPLPLSLKGYQQQQIPVFPAPERAVDAMAALIHRNHVIQHKFKD